MVSQMHYLDYAEAFRYDVPEGNSHRIADYSRTILSTLILFCSCEVEVTIG